MDTRAGAFHEYFVSQGGENGGVECPCSPNVRDVDEDVVKHFDEVEDQGSAIRVKYVGGGGMVT